ncbi:MAG: hypothetical protein N2645_22685 [Clostridia bacterium]|nr:hypothetical protein [Clostridia bacterium]
MYSENNKIPTGLTKWLPLLSGVLGAGALWYSWFSISDMTGNSGVHWYEWRQPVFILLLGVLCLAATSLLIAGKSSGWTVFTWGLMMVPIMLIVNLVVLAIRIVQNVLQGNALPFFKRLFDDPSKLIFIPIVILALVLLGALDKNKSK